MKTIKLFMVTALIALCAISCGSDKKKEKKDPATIVVEQYCEAVMAQDFEKAVSFFEIPEINGQKMSTKWLVKMMKEDAKANPEKNEGVSYKVVKSEIDEEAGTATVTVELTKDGALVENMALPVKKFGDSWKIDLANSEI